jgi:acyl-CoA synthetase (AMP-forming)/AMP-acid ligase II
MSITLHHLIQRHARYRGQHTALVFDGHEYSWRAFAAQVNQLAQALLHAGIVRGDKVATVLPNSLELITLYWATTRIGAVVVPLSPLLQRQGVVNLLRNSNSRMVFLQHDLWQQLQEVADELPAISARHYIVTDSVAAAPNYRQFMATGSAANPADAAVRPDDLFNIVYSSGTTGEPKGIEHSHYVRSQYAVHFAASFRMTPESVVLHSGSIVFNGAFVTLMPCFFLGATYVLQRTFDVEAMIQAIAKYRVTHIMLVPAQIIALLQSPYATPEKLGSLQMVLTLGAPLQQKDREALMALLPGRYHELYGLTEGFVTILDKMDAEHKPGSVGCPPPGGEMRIVDEQGNEVPAGVVGEITGYGPLRMNGYYGRPDLTAETVRDGWIYTGDLGYVDEDGYLYLVDRKKDMILSGSVNVYPRDIENVMAAHEAVLEVAVFGVPSDKWGEVPVAAVVLKPGVELTGSGLLAWTNQRVEARFQRIQGVMILREFPRNAAGKTLKNRLAEMYKNERRCG